MTLRAASLALVLALGAPQGAVAAEAHKPILDRAASHQPGALQLWERLVNNDSGTGDAEGVNAVGAIAIEELGGLVRPSKPCRRLRRPPATILLQA
jgi:hypothetical protein